jgi:uncharacterized protein YcaQ
VYAAHEHGPEPSSEQEQNARLDALVDVAVGLYAPVPLAGLSYLVRRLRYAVPQWHADLKGAFLRAQQRLQSTALDGTDWYWPAGERLLRRDPPEQVRLLTPFDPLVWDRGRFELFWGWKYRFEAYTPAPKRIFGYYAMPLLWRDQVIGWANLGVAGGKLQAEFGYVAGQQPRDPAFNRELEAEQERLRIFLGLT